MMYDLLVVGGGAAGFFGALEAASCNPRAKIIILEKTNQLLAKGEGYRAAGVVM